jgi:outer membrane protein assembly factor BamB
LDNIRCIIGNTKNFRILAMNKLRIPKNTSTVAIAFTIMFVITATLPSISSVNAADEATGAFLAVNPNPVGVDQQVVVSAWIEPFPPTANDVYHGLAVTIGKPDGTTETLGPVNSYQSAQAFWVFTPDSVGNYTFQFTYPGETFSSIGAYREPSESPITVLIVQQQPVQAYPESSLPTEYWARPITAENRLWSSIAGNWLMGGYNAEGTTYDSANGFNPYTQAPKSAHILWTKDFNIGGLVGGEYGDTSYYAGHTYETRVTPPIIMNGRLYYRLYQSASGIAGTYPGFICVDLRTGQELWRNTTGNIDIGQLWNYVSSNQMGVVAYLWDISGSTWSVYDAWQGTLMLQFANASSSFYGLPPIVYASDGTICAYFLNPIANYLVMWNSTKAFEENGLITYSSALGKAAGAGQLRPKSGTYDWRKGVQWIVTIPDLRWTGMPGMEMLWGVSDGVLLGELAPTGFQSGALSDITTTQAGYDAATGKQLWAVNRTISGGLSIRRSFGEGIYTQLNPQTMTYYGFDIHTGQQLWESDPMNYPWGTYSTYGSIAYGMLYNGAYDGCMHAFNVTNGKEVWEFYSGNSGTETPYGSWPMFMGPIIGGDVVFCANGEHSPNQPSHKGEKLYALDANTGLELWNITGWMGVKAIADGILIAANAYDNQIYAFGKGPSATTVTAPDITVDFGKAVMIKGSVVDITAGTSQDEQSARFPNGVPAISDDDMSEWMEYVYMQKPKPIDVTGVEVVISVLDSNGNYYDIGTATTDDSGMFSLMWTPEIPGEFTVVATFAGSESYYGSYAETAFGVMEAPETTPEPTPQPASAADLYFLPMSIGTIVAIIAIGLVLILMLRKR